METFASLWGVYLVVAILSCGYIAYNQVRRIRRMWNDSNGDPFESMAEGLLSVTVAVIVATLSFGALVASVLYWLVVAIAG